MEGSEDVSHLVAKDAYKSLEERINKYPQGAPKSETLNEILKLLFSEREADLVSKLPVRPFNSARASKAWKLPLDETEKNLRRTSFSCHFIRYGNKRRSSFYATSSNGRFF